MVGQKIFNKKLVAIATSHEGWKKRVRSIIYNKYLPFWLKNRENRNSRSLTGVGSKMKVGGEFWHKVPKKIYWAPTFLLVPTLTADEKLSMLFI